VTAETFSLMWLGSVFGDHRRCIDEHSMTVILSGQVIPNGILLRVPLT
jgi:hypothetical protein